MCTLIAIDEINNKAIKFDETILMGQSFIPSKLRVKKTTNDAFAIITNVIQILLKKSKSNKEKIIKVRNPKLNTSLLM